MRAFRHLSTTRQLGMSQGPIPYHRVTAYAREAGLDRMNTGLLVEVLAEMDKAYLEWCAEDTKRRGKSGKGELGNRTVEKGNRYGRL